VGPPLQGGSLFDPPRLVDELAAGVSVSIPVLVAVIVVAVCVLLAGLVPILTRLRASGADRRAIQAERGRFEAEAYVRTLEAWIVELEQDLRQHMVERERLRQLGRVQTQGARTQPEQEPLGRFMAQHLVLDRLRVATQRFPAVHNMFRRIGRRAAGRV
jgi:hypothetical protein